MNTIFGIEIPDWLENELVTRYSEYYTVNAVMSLLLEDYIKRNTPIIKDDCEHEYMPDKNCPACQQWMKGK